jgi:hypothetical protein
MDLLSQIYGNLIFLGSRQFLSGGCGESAVSPCRSKYFVFRRDILSRHVIAYSRKDRPRISDRIDSDISPFTLTHRHYRLFSIFYKIVKLAFACFGRRVSGRWAAVCAPPRTRRHP